MAASLEGKLHLKKWPSVESCSCRGVGKCIYHVTKAVQAVVGSMIVVGVLTHCILLHSMYNL